ncbi:MAG TPA: exosortase A [Rhodanobacteraceae bacterium]|nr:exosortase A [Rhodanobacteraceae bacterium]
MNVQFAAADGMGARISSWGWAVAAFATAVLVLLVGYWQTAASLVWVWAHDGTYQYAFLIFPLSAWVAFGMRQRLREHAPVPSVWGLAAAAVLISIWYAGYALSINLLQHFAFVALFPALVLTCWGWRALWTLKFPLAYLVVFAVPWGDGMVGPLQDLTARMAVYMLDLTGMPVLLNGREIMTPSAIWMVEQACSGVKFFIACVALGSLYAYLMYRRTWKRVMFVVLSAIVPIVANGLRVYFTILIGETWGLKYASGTDHLIFGWQFFGTVLVVLLLLGWFFRDRLVAQELSPARQDRPVRMRAGVWLAVLALLVTGPVLAATLAAAVPPKALELAAPSVTGWHGPDTTRSPWQPVFHGAAGQVRAAYREGAGAEPVELFHAVYTGKPRSGHSLITYGNNVYDPSRARIVATADRGVELADGTSVTARELRLSTPRGERLVWYWYCVDRRCTASPVLTKLLQVWQTLRGGAARSSVWALSLPVAHNADERARAALRAFARVMPDASAKLASGGAAALAGAAR